MIELPSNALPMWLLLTGGALAALALHPFTTYPLSLLLLRRLRPPRKPSDAVVAPASFSILVCGYNEERCIQEKVLNLMENKRELELAGHAAQVLIYTDGCTDRTVEIIRGLAQPVELVEGVERAGKSVGMKQLVARASGEYLIFTDADIMLNSASLTKVPAYFADPKVGCVCGHLRYSNGEASDTAQVGGLYWRFEEWLKHTESDLDSTVAAAGALFVIRRDLFRPVPSGIIDDMFTSTGIFVRGYRLVQALDVVGHQRGAVTQVEEWRRKVRIACRSFNCHRLLGPELKNLPLLRKYFYYSHKYVRWVSGMLLPVAVLLLLLAVFLWHPTLALLLVAGAVVGLGLGFAGLPVLSQMTGLLTSLMAASWGVVESLRGRKYQTWTPPATSR